MKKNGWLGLLLMLLTLTQCTYTKQAEMMQQNKNEMTEEIDMNRVKVLIKTTYGDITIALYNETPKHRDNFLKLVETHYYDGVLFHRVIQNFMIQTGDPNSKNASQNTRLGGGDPTYTVPAEFNQHLIHKRGAIAAARLGDNVNPAKESSGSQFYIVDGRVFSNEELAMFEQRHIYLSRSQKEVYTTIGGSPHLDGNYTVFGEVLEGMDVVDKIAAVQKDRYDRPLTDIKIISMTIIK